MSRSLTAGTVAGALALVAVTGALEANGSASIAQRARNCKGNVVKIGGRPACIAAGQPCKARYERTYEHFGFRCRSGRLVRKRPARPPSPPPLSGVVASIPAPGDGTLEASEGAVWVVSMFDDTKFLRIDPRTNAVAATVLGAAPPSRGGYYGIEISSSAVWLSTSWEANIVSRVDPSTNAIVARIGVGTDPEGIAVTADAVWVANHHDGTVSRIDPATNQTVATVNVGPAGDSGPHDIFAAAGALWVDVPNLASVVRIDPATNKAVATIAVAGGGCRVVSGTDEGIWVAGGSCGGGLDHIDPHTNAVVATVPSSELGGEAAGIAIGFGSVWVAVRSTARGPGPGGFLARVDPASTKVVARYATEGVPEAVAVSSGSIWLRELDRVLRIIPETSYSSNAPATRTAAKGDSADQPNGRQRQRRRSACSPRGRNWSRAGLVAGRDAAGVRRQRLEDCLRDERRRHRAAPGRSPVTSSVRPPHPDDE